MSVFVNILLLICITVTKESNPTLKIAQYENVTLESCGWSTYSFAKSHTKCFSWHKTYKQLRNELGFANIRGGREVKYGEFPYTVLIEHKATVNNTMTISTCTGAILNGRWIITNAHCLDKKRAEDFYVYIGYTTHPKLSDGYEPLKAVEYIIHHMFYDEYTNNFQKHGRDIGLLKLETEIDFSPENINKINSVCLPERGFKIGSEEWATLSGWGQIRKDVFNERRLKALSVKLRPADNGSLPFPWIYSNFSDAMGCPGDSGAPLVEYKNGRAILIGLFEGKQLLGVDIFGQQAYDTGCVNDEHLMVFTRIGNFVDWIVNTTLERS